MKYTKKETIEVVLDVAPCLECGSESIAIEDCGYNSFNVGGGRCAVCGHESTSDCSVDPDVEELIDIWNRANSIELLIKQQETIIENAQKEIVELKARNGNDNLALKITGAKDGMMWYANKIGETVPYLGKSFHEYRSREDSGYINFVRIEDCEVVRVGE